MAWYNIKGDELAATVPVKDEEGNIVGWKFNPGEDAEWREANGYIYDHNPVPPPPPPPPEPEPSHTVFTKLKIRRAMRSLGIEAKLDALLAASHDFAADWADAQEIDLADPVLVEALTAGSITAEEIEAIRNEIEHPQTAEEAALEAEA